MWGSHIPQRQKREGRRKKGRIGRRKDTGESRTEPELLQHLEVCPAKRSKGDREGGTSEMKEGKSVFEAKKEKEKKIKERKEKSTKEKGVGKSV